MGCSLACFLGAHTLGCRETLEPTEVMIAVDSDMKAGTELSALRLSVYSVDESEAPLRAQTISLSTEPGPGVQTLPLTLSIAAEQRDSRTRFRVVVTGMGPETPDKPDSTTVDLVEQQAIVGFVPGQRPLLEMYLSRRCVDMLCRGQSGKPRACSLETATCAVVEAIDASTLPQAVGDGLGQLTVPKEPRPSRTPDATMPPLPAEPDGGEKMPTCDPGYALLAGLCEDVDECLDAPFPCPEGTCANLPGTYRCEPCETGYRADGAGTCVDLDECAFDNGGCDARTTCTNTPGSRTCGACPSGYSGDGESGCVGMGPCAMDNGGCDAVTTCTADATNVTCGACPAGYTGDGDTGCAPQLLDLGIDHGVLQPAFAPDVTRYIVDVPLLADSANIAAFVPAGASATVAQQAVPAAGEPVAVTLNLGQTIVPVTLSRPGQPTKTYLITFIRGELEAYLKASNTGMDDRFGLAVALDGDTLAVGARFESSAAVGTQATAAEQADDSLSRSGAVYVFARNGSTWTQQAYLKASNPDVDDVFGDTVALDGDTLIVGATGEASSATGTQATPSEQSNNGVRNAGAAYVFVRDGSTWTQQAYLKASNTGIADYFGAAVDISGDTVVVGAPFEDSSASGTRASVNDQADDNLKDSGAVYLFRRSNGQWTQEAYLKASNPGAGDDFGSSVSLSGETLVVGAMHESSAASGVPNSAAAQTDDSLPSAGAAYVFVRNGGTWTQQAYLKASNPGQDDRFGRPVMISGDMLAVSAWLEDSNGTGMNPPISTQSDDSLGEAGAVYLFERSGTEWSQTAFIKAPNPDEKDQFGASLGLSNNWLAIGTGNESGSDRGVTPAPPDTPDNLLRRSGAAYLYRRLDTTWTLDAFIKASNPEGSDGFGNLSLSGSSIAIGAASEDSSATGTTATSNDQADNNMSSSGAVYVY